MVDPDRVRAAVQELARSVSPTAHNRVEVLHGVNLDLLGRRPSEHYGELTLIELETRVKRFGRELDLELAFFQTNHEGEFVERLHRLPDAADAVILNPGPGRTTAMRSVTRSRSPRCPRSRCTCPTSRRASSGAATRCSRAWWSRRSPARARTATGRRSSWSNGSSGCEPGSSERAERLVEAVGEAGLDQLIVGDLVRPGDSGPDASADIRWLTGFTGTSAIAVVGSEARLFLTDFRYIERAEREVGEGFERITVEGRLLSELAPRLLGRIGFDDSATSVASLRKLEAAIADQGTAGELVATSGLVAGLRRRKDAGEQEAIAAAAQLADEAYRMVLEAGLVGRSERQVAEAAEARIRELGGEPAFPTIVAAGANGALPHAEASEHEIRAGELVVWDMGAKLDGYCSDCTRTFAAGELGEPAREVYELVRLAQAAGLEAVGSGVGGTGGR